ncbi:hypothetical protein HYH03_018853 [Edaphochlamys debaryana]|uniref:Uncharacterized protein n=1 Tax=Edaphochlamys debaryana TaxID=47281 RepID=A0A835XDV3_9CHLO|nr:hypothetical protein HYH03_018853 [Edaphochlamys debaryana]|eukprot:KAG2482208.1 hypothetical protein HYH03_018853 [Edaphochlamys debaryana]
MQEPATPAVNDTRYTYSGSSTPRCLPCHLQSHPVMGEVLRLPGRGGFAPALGCPCTAELACSQRPQPDFVYLGNSTEACMRGLTWPEEAPPKQFGGFFALVELMTEHLDSRSFWPEGDMFITSFLAKIRLWFTDLGTYWWTRGDSEQTLHTSSFGAKQRMGGHINRWSKDMLDNRCTHESGCLHDFLSGISHHKLPIDHQLLTDAWRHYYSGGASGGHAPRHRNRRSRRRRAAS